MNIINRAFRSFMRGPIYVILFGLIFFGIGGGLTYRQYMFEQQAIPVQGKVTGHTMDCDDEGCSYKSVVSFITQDGKSISYTSTYSSNPPAHDVGEVVTIFYAPNNPNDAAITGEGIVFRIIFMGVGGIIILFGLGFFASNVKNSYLTEE